MPAHGLDLIAFVMLTTSVTLDWPVDLKCCRVKELISAVHDIKKYSGPHSPFLLLAGRVLAREKKSPSVLVPRLRRLRKAKRAMGTRMIKSERDPRASATMVICLVRRLLSLCHSQFVREVVGLLLCKCVSTGEYQTMYFLFAS